MSSVGSTFRPTGSSHFLAVGTTSSAVQVTNVTQASEFMITNISNSDYVYITIGFGSAPTAVIPTSGNPQLGFPLLHGDTIIVSATANSYVAGICPSGTHNIIITPGEAIR